MGVGALGPVFRTYEPTRDRLVAVKVFRLDITPEQAQSLADELAKAADAGLFHPSVVEPIAAGVEGTVAYRAEEYVAAESLDVALRHYAPAALDKVLPFITQLAGAIDFARASGVGHGALHPRDIFVTPEEARATGFGVVEALERMGQRAPVRRPYSAPERVAGDDWGTPADVFSLGVIAFELLTGRRPAGTGAEIGPLTGAVMGSGTDAVQAVLARAMHDDPARRYQSALAFASALESAARGVAPDSSEVAAIAAVAASQIDDSLPEMPPVAGIDEREEPAEAELEDDLFRSEPEDVVEQEVEEEEAAPLASTSDTVDDEDDDFDLDDEDLEEEDEDEPASLASADVIGFSDDLKHLDDDDEISEPIITEPAPSRYASVMEPPDVDLPVDEGDDDRDAVHAPEFAAVSAERPGPAFLPLAVVGILCLLVGFGAGRFTAPGDSAPATVAQAPAAETPQTPAAPGGAAYSEQTVAPSATPQTAAQQQQQPPAEPPPIPAETPPGATSKPAATRPAATTGRIVVNSTPTRAGVTLNGTWRGRTPLTIGDLPFGSYTVRVVQPGFTVAMERMTLTAEDADKTFAAVLKRSSRSAPRAATPPPAPREAPSRTGSLYIDSRPRGATVYVDGKNVGVTPLRLGDIAFGPHAVRLELANHSTWRTSTNVVVGREARVTGSLERIR